MSTFAQSTEKFSAIWDKEHITHILPSDVRHADLKTYLQQLKKLGLSVEEVGRSGSGREIYQLQFGSGPLKVFMWSQMHGDEPTATSALVDMFAFFQKNRKLDWVRQIENTITLRAVPMLNPDGAELFQRRNLQGIDINRDALDLKTPEARLLKRLRDEWMPDIGFNLHNQGGLTTVGNSWNQATISLLVVYGDEAKTTSAGHERNTRLAAAMATALQKLIPGHIARYDDEWTPTAFGDNFSAWGTPTILIETGALFGKDEMFLVKLNFVAFLTALHSLATGSEAKEANAPYLSLIENGAGSLVNFVFRRANVVTLDNLSDPPSTAVHAADIAVAIERRRASFAAPTVIRNIGDLSGIRGLQEYDASGFYVFQRFATMKSGELAEFFFYKKDRAINWRAADLEKQFPPDAIFSLAKWAKGEALLPKIR